jgi:DNA-binding NtrC family response regulator
VTARVLVVDDREDHRYAVRRVLEAEGYQIEEAGNGEQALNLLTHGEFDLVILDITMPGMGGMECLERIRQRKDAPPVIMLTAYGSERQAVECLKAGAYDYIPKPYEVDELKAATARALERERLVAENAALKARLADEQASPELGRSPSMAAVRQLVETFAPTDVTVLLLGESGTGKEVIAREIHRRSPRASQPFVAVNCAALPEQLVESELFGHEKGAFTGASETRKGKFEAADDGTLFLDEVGDTTPGTQTKLLRVLQERAFERLGSNKTLRVDVRILASTNRDLAAMVSQGTFREDLYYRLKVAAIQLPPLRQRREDIPLLAERFLAEAAARHGKQAGGIGGETMDKLVTSRWQGNVRELRNALEYAAVVADGARVTPEMLPQDLREPGVTGAPDQRTVCEELEPLPFSEAKKIAQERFERAYIEARLKTSKGNVSEAARAMGLARQSLQAKLKELGIEAARFRLKDAGEDAG